MRLTQLQAHCEQYGKGCGSELCKTATHIVLCKGKLPCDVLFIGEAPGQNEDTMGIPFVGPAGQLLDSIISQSVPPRLRLAFTNLVACIPLDEDGRKTVAPDDDTIMQCQPRLRDFIRIANPRMVVRVGKHAQDWIGSGYMHGIALPQGVKVLDLLHPAAILKGKQAYKGVNIQKCMFALEEACESL